MAFLLLALAPARAQAPPAHAAARIEQANSLQQKGALQEARATFRALVPDLRAGRDDRNLAETLHHLSQIGSSLGDYKEALQNARESAEISRKLGDRASEARALNDSGVAEFYVGQYAAALDDFEHSLRLHRSIGDFEGEVSRLNNIASVFTLQGKYLNALQTYQTALDLANRARSQSWSARLHQGTTANLAALYHQRLGQHDRALELYRQLLQTPETLTTSERARLTANLGVLYRQMGDPYKALETYRTAQELFDRERHFDGEIGVLKNIGIARALDLADYRGAQDTFSMALRLAGRTSNRREVMVARLYLGETFRRMGRMDEARAEIEPALEMAKELGTTEEQWKALYALGRISSARGDRETAKAYFDQAIAVIEHVRSGLTLAPLKSEFLADKRDVYDARVGLALDETQGTPSPQQLETILDLIERARARNFVDRIKDLPRGIYPVKLSAIQRSLDDSTAALVFWIGNDRLAALWITRSGAGIVAKPFATSEARQLDALLHEISEGSGEGWRTSAREVGQYLLGNLPPLGNTTIRRLAIVPDGALYPLPFETLAVPPGGSGLLLERFDTFYLPSLLLLLRDARPLCRAPAPPWTLELAAFADPGASAGGMLPGDERWSTLPASREEARSIAAILPGRAQIHTGPDANKQNLRGAAASHAPLLHLATHAATDSESPERSRILLSAGATGSKLDYLFLGEIYDLDLRAAELVTLSACETEKGKLIRGEGVEAFSRAFLAAGARATVTSLWRIADEPSAEIMKQFYYFLSRGRTKSEALRGAKLQLLNSRSRLSHPRYWAAFVLNGEGLEPVRLPLSWISILLAALVIVAAAATVVGRIGRRS